MATQQLITRDNDILDGTPVFSGTRVPIETLLDYLEGGKSIDEFIDDFPTVGHDCAVAVLQLLRRSLIPEGIDARAA